ncbi:MAG: pantoate--beta-alanine ligase [bacterium]|nr:pantoate--beta-alanine ligase [bacterium]
MKVIRTIEEVREEIKTQQAQGRSIGFVPTMGALHRGHLSLVEACRKENDITVVSIFVNPAQFGPNEDLDRYPRDFEGDEALLKDLGVDLVFYPGLTAIYPPGYSTYVEVEKRGNVLCGSSRPGHFRGVATVVLKLFNIVKPDVAYFGRKDAQQAVILKRMVTDLNLEVELKVRPITRAADGLALSSRNVYLSAEERAAALYFSRALVQAKERIAAGLRDVPGIRDLILEELKKSPLISVDYVEVVRLDTLEPFPEGTAVEMENTLVAGAVRVGNTRLIDNFILGEV